MLQRRQMLSAKELQLPKKVVEALVALRDDLRDGKCPHKCINDTIGWSPMYAFERRGPTPSEVIFYFNMAHWYIRSGSDRICCIGGLVEARTGYNLMHKAEKAHLALCYPGGYPAVSGNVAMYQAITPDQAADAIDNFLYEGDPQWDRILTTG
jgi:hypothetical protein